MAFKVQKGQYTDDKRTGQYYEGKEIILTKSSGQPIKKARHNRDWWPEEKRIEAATVFAVTRNYENTHKLVGIPVRVLKKMAMEPWWSQIIEKVRVEKNEVLDDKITDALDKALDIVLDRYEHGEHVYDRSAKKYRRDPVKIKDISHMTQGLFDKRQLIRNKPTAVTEKVSTDERLKKLKENFEKLAHSVGINPKREIIDGSSQREDEKEVPKETKANVQEQTKQEAG